jgi:phosphatidylserine decarboxylase
VNKNQFKINFFALLTNITRKLTQIILPTWILKPILKIYIKKYSINTSEIQDKLETFTSIDSFFIRSLKKELRPINNESNSVISPVDSFVQQTGKIIKNTIIQAKGVNYSVEKLIPSSTANNFLNGQFITLYLSPADCHRMFSPVKGNITGIMHVPGALYPVCEPYISNMENLYTKNERVITYIKTTNGLIAMIKVAALNVGNISLEFDNSFCQNRNNQKTHEIQYKEKIAIEKGQHISTFHLGSTVILLFQENMITLESNLLNKKIRYGEKIGSF